MTRSSVRLALTGCILLLAALWLPGLRYPVVSDTAFYALLGKSFWTDGTYTLFGVPYAKHLPLHALLSYPLVAMFGWSLGMKISTLLAGWAVVLLTFAVLRRAFGSGVALAAAALLSIHHGFVFMTMLGSADLLFTSLFLVAIFAVLRAKEDERWYLAAGITAGLSCVTRYNGVPVLLALPLIAYVQSPRRLASPWLWAGMILGATALGLWFARNAVAFGNPLHSLYTSELARESKGPLLQLVSNAGYYLNPIHNILPLLLLCSFYGIWRFGRAQRVLLLAMFAVWVLTAIWWVQAMRFAMPGYPLLLGFAVAGLADIWRQSMRWSKTVIIASVAILALTHLPALCFYAYGQCNAWVDRHVSWIPHNLGLTSEGFFAWAEARDAFNELAPPGAVIAVDNVENAIVGREGVFRPDIRVVSEVPRDACVYRITQHPTAMQHILWRSPSAPVTAVVVEGCGTDGEEEYKALY
jgi:4-amino-4-deoxy-L-arabinose transferase-like glycosyltransferase